MRNDYVRNRSYEMIDLSAVPDDAFVISGGIMGSVRVLDQFSPEEIVDQWEKQFEPLLALRAMESYVGRKVDFVVPFELGGLNTPVILSLAARLGIPTIDGDGVGRAAPETQMTSFIGHGVSLVPMPLVDWKGNVIIVDKAVTPFFPDEVGRFVVTQAGGIGANSHYPMDGKTARSAILPGTISTALDLGNLVSDLMDANKVVDRVTKHLGGQLVFRGIVRSLEEQEALGFLVQTAQLEGTSASAGDEMEIVIKNEFMMASLNGSVGCVFPDLILMIDERGQGVMSSELKVGDTAYIVVAPCHPRLRESAMSAVGKEALGPQRYGRPMVTYKPVETLSTSWGLVWPPA